LFQTNSREVEATSDRRPTSRLSSFRRTLVRLKRSDECRQLIEQAFQTNSREVEAGVGVDDVEGGAGFRRTLVRLKPRTPPVARRSVGVSDELS